MTLPPTPLRDEAYGGRGSILLDHAVFPSLVAGPVAAASALLDRGVPNLLVTPLVVGVFTAGVAVLERARPERSEHRELDQPLYIEALHFLFGLEFGYGAALGACALIDRAVRAAPLPAWPGGWPVAMQLLLALLLYEGTSYWQHRLLHRAPSLWRLHSLHHSGGRLNLVRAVRFHALDLGTAGFVAYLPLVLLAAPERLLTLLGVLLSALGILQHANIRMRTPAWLDRLVCTPAVHRHHHSIARAENDQNFGNTVMLFDILFGTYGAPRPGGPEATGLFDDRVPQGFWAQVLSPLVGLQGAPRKEPGPLA